MMLKMGREMMRSLAFKWTLTLLLTSLIGVVVAAVFASRTALLEYDRLRIDQARALFVENVTTYYMTYRTWDGLDNWLRYDRDDDLPRDSSRPPLQFALLDSQGVVILGYGPFNEGDLFPINNLNEGAPLIIDGQRVGTVMLTQPPPELDRFERCVRGQYQSRFGRLVQ